MQPDDPTVPNLGWPRPSAGQAPSEFRGGADPLVRSEVPTWPGVSDHLPQGHALHQAPRSYVSRTAFGLSLAANVVLLFGLVSLLLLGQAGLFAPGGALGPSAPSSPTSRALIHPTATARATLAASGLQLTPDSVQLGCTAGTTAQVVVLENPGPEPVTWQATFSLPAQQAGVSLTPQRGELAAGATIQLQVQNTLRTSRHHSSSSQQGSITFASGTPDAGPPATLTYTAEGCR